MIQMQTMLHVADNSGVYSVDAAGNVKGLKAGSGKLTTMEEYLRGIINVFSPADGQSELVYRPEKPDCANFLMDISNCRADLGYEPQYDCLAFLEDYKREMEKDQKK